eukprot:CAMPEP_0194448088 /NCGR_PEP_ID=MMETSP0176-20130528/129377_1 /TAXON_ID=216777 /ORGANISM="Proboscia alata, Strain PI-D3" /LENGTH=265 /DNA_ID=CAMNT_0039275025 /DNA_START=52 /DNA_END=845 /DNA_ORIENTATION=-
MQELASRHDCTSRVVSSLAISFLLIQFSASVCAFLPNNNHGRSLQTLTSPFGISSSLQSSFAEDAISSSTSTSTVANNNNYDRTTTEDDGMSMPWSNLQEWALNDNLPKYLVAIPSPDPTGNTPPRQCALWRTLLRDTIELAGYDPQFVRSQMENPPQILPLLTDFEFTPEEGLSGTCYGLTGVADGTRVSTPALWRVDRTVPLGYVYTKLGDVAYELGEPAGTSSSSTLSALSGALATSASNLNLEGTKSAAKSVGESVREKAL